VKKVVASVGLAGILAVGGIGLGACGGGQPAWTQGKQYGHSMAQDALTTGNYSKPITGTTSVPPSWLMSFLTKICGSTTHPATGHTATWYDGCVTGATGQVKSDGY